MSTARADLVAATRLLAAAVGRTDIDEPAMAALAAQIADLVPTLEHVTRVGVPRTAFDDAVGAGVYAWQDFNPALPAIHMRFSEGVASADLVDGLGHLYEGPAGLVHGGVSAMLMDTMLSSAVQFHGHRTVTASLTADYRRPVRLDRPLHLSGRVEQVEGRKVVASGELSCDGEVCVEVRGLFVTVPEV